MFAFFIVSLSVICPVIQSNLFIDGGISIQANLDNFLASIYKENAFETLLLMHSSDETNPFTKYSYAYPTLRQTELQAHYLHEHYSDRLLALIFLSERFDAALTTALAENLQHMRQVRIIFLLKSFNRLLMNEILEYCAESEMIHAIFLTISNLKSGDYYYRLTPFPNYQIIQLKFGSSDQHFLSNITRDFGGCTLLTLPDQNEGRSIVYMNKKTGKLVLSGYVGKLILLFAEHHNLTIQYLYPVKLDQQVHVTECLTMTRNFTIPLAISLFGNFPRNKKGEFSYPLEQARWTIMAPCARPLPLEAIFTIVANGHLCVTVLLFYFGFSAYETINIYIFRRVFHKSLTELATNFLINERLFPGIIGQPFKLPATSLSSLGLIYQLICIIGLILNTLIVAHHQTLLTTRPLGKQIASFDDMRRTGIKFLVLDLDIPLLRYLQGTHYFDDIQDIVKKTSKDDFFHQRHSFNTSYAYAVSSALWTFYSRRQEFFTHPLFCEVRTLVISSTLYMSVPLKANSVYTAPLDRLISIVHDFGLLDYWRRSTFYEMVSLRKFRLNDLNPAQLFRSFRLTDLRSAWIVLTGGMILSMFVFFCELAVHHFKNTVDNTLFKI